MLEYTITYLNPYVFEEMKNVNIFHLKPEEIDTFYKLFKPYYNIQFSGKIPIVYDLDEDVAEELFRLSNGCKVNPSIQKSQLPFRSISMNDIITIYDITGPKSYFYMADSVVRLREVVL